MNSWKKPRTKVVGWCALLALLVALAGTGTTVRAAKHLGIGKPAPDFTLNSQEDTPVSLHDFRRKWVVLYFYPKDFTSGCTIEAHDFQRDLPLYEAKNAVILGVSVQSTDSHRDFCVKEGLSFKLLADTNHEVSAAYGSLSNLFVMRLASRHTFLINPEGIIVKEFLDVDPSKHSLEVLAALTQLQQSATAQ